MDQAFSKWPQSLWSSNSTKHKFEPISPCRSYDVVIIGAGYSGLWSAHHLLSLNPSLSISIVDAQQPGFGASGRNGGWCSAFSPMSLDGVAQQTSVASAVALQNALISSVDEIGDYISQHDIDCGWHKGGTLCFATNRPQLHRIQESIRSFRSFGFEDDFMTYLSPQDSTSRVNVPGSLGASYSPHCATIHPARLVDGLVNQLLSQGVEFFGTTQVTAIQPHKVTALTPSGIYEIDTKWIIRATEGFTARIPQFRRDVAPLYSYMIATEPLSEKQWSDIGWVNRETVSDARNLVVYAQKTTDGRIAFGGRGAPYKFASAIHSQWDSDPTIHGRIEESMRAMFPAIADCTVTHRWGGALGVHRDWFASAHIDHDTHYASLGGYVGDGVALSFVAARQVALSIATRSVSSPLPIVNHQSRRWEPEPFRWIGINALLKITALEDLIEEKTGRTQRFIMWLLGKIIP